MPTLSFAHTPQMFVQWNVNGYSVEIDVSWNQLSMRVFIAENSALKLGSTMILFYIMDFSNGGTLISACFHVE